MKRFLCLFSLTMAISWGVVAQNDTARTPAQKDTETLVTQYQLDENQAAEMLKIQERKYRNLAEIQPIKDQDPILYLRKLRALVRANEASFERLFDEAQNLQFRKYRTALREEKAQRYQQLKAENTPQELIELQLLELELQHQ